jgi:DNA-binding transcriptional regulator YdaS (Cro superfamily)
MHLDEYLRQTRQNQGDFGATLIPAASQALVSQWVRGVTRITLDYALQIDKRSNGLVKPQDCADMYVGPSARASPKPAQLPA